MEKIKGVLTVDKERGVVYFHSDDGACPLRLDGLESPDTRKAQIDIRIHRGALPDFDILPRDIEGDMVIAEVVSPKTKQEINRRMRERYPEGKKHKRSTA